VDQGTTHQYGRQGLDDALWEMASRENPDPTSYVNYMAPCSKRDATGWMLTSQTNTRRGKWTPGPPETSSETN
jgi:hypothetical protein